MEGFLEILFNALPEALGALIAAGIITLLSFLFVKWKQVIEFHNSMD